jgi:hypothetical protein
MLSAIPTFMAFLLPLAAWNDPPSAPPRQPARQDLQGSLGSHSWTSPRIGDIFREARPAWAGPETAGQRMVNLGYQHEDALAIDYQLWRLPGTGLDCRGPGFAELPERFFVAVGAAQTFGRFVPRPYCAIVADRIGLPGVNLGFSGAGPSFFTRNPALLGVINRAEFAIVQFLSGRSVSNSRFGVQINQGLVRPRDAAPDAAALFAEDAYRRFLQEETVEEAVRLRTEARVAYVAEMNALLDSIRVPVVLMYWSTREPDYADGIESIGSYWGEFPHFVNAAVVSRIKDRADRYVEAVTRRGLPQLIVDRAGRPLVMWPEDRFPGVEQRSHNHYYPAPEMHEDAAEAVLAALPLTPAPRPRPARRDVLVHFHIYQNGGTAIDARLQQYFGPGWAWLLPPDTAACMTDEPLVEMLASRPDISALSSHQLRFPLRGSNEIRLHPLVMLRHPIDRVRSMYEYERTDARQQTSQLVHTLQAAKLGFAAWVEWCLSDPGLASPIENLQTRACSFRHNGIEPNDWTMPPDLGNLTEALAVISELPAVGVAEEFRLTAARFTARFASLFPDLNFSSAPAGASGQIPPAILFDGDRALNPDAVSARLAAIRRELGDALYQRLLRANELDLELYAQARRQLVLSA